MPINDNLEVMAKQLYDYWFVQFDFPNEEGKPYKSSGGAMVWNEKLKREIPQGWTAVKIKDVAQTYSGGTPTSTNSEYYDGGDIPWINSGELNNPIITSTTNYITEEGLNNSSAKLYPQDTVLVALYGATAGKVSLLSFEACSNQAVCGVIPQNKIMTTYIRYYLSSLYEYFITLSSGSARDNISQDTIKNTILPIPQGKILKKFSDAVAPIISKIIANQKEMENLTKQRDELLPLLMNGQASINYHLSASISISFDISVLFLNFTNGNSLYETISLDYQCFALSLHSKENTHGTIQEDKRHIQQRQRQGDKHARERFLAFFYKCTSTVHQAAFGNAWCYRGYKGKDISESK